MATRLPTVLLEHRSKAGRHYDWLLGDPGRPRGRLWTARVMVPSRRWSSVGAWDVEPIGPHRRVYLKFEGPLTGGRGSVRRIDSGSHRPVVWTRRRIVTDITMARCSGRVEIRQLGSGKWRARFTARRGSSD